MKDMNWLTIKVLLLFGGLTFGLILCAWNLQGQQSDQLYQVSLNRMEYAIREFEKENGRAVKDLQELKTFAGLSDYDGITGLSWIDRQEDNTPKNTDGPKNRVQKPQDQAIMEKEAKANYLNSETDKADFWNNHGQNYAVIDTETHYYKVTYHCSDSEERLLFWVIGEALLFLIGIVILLCYLGGNLLVGNGFAA